LLTIEAGAMKEFLLKHSKNLDSLAVVGEKYRLNKSWICERIPE